MEKFKNPQIKNFKFIEDYLSKVELNEKTALCTVILSISDVCNLKCWCCPRGHGYVRPEGIPDFMSLDTVKLLCNQLGKDFCGRFSISGLGEPTLHPQFIEIVNMLNDLCPQSYIILITNGVKLTDEIVNMKCIKEIEISVYSREDEDYFTSKYENYDGYGYNKRLKIRPMYIEHLSSPVNNRAGNVFYISPREVPDTVCYMPFYQVTVDTDGTIHHCSSDWKRIDTIGNIYEENVYDIYINNFKNMREKQLNHDRKSLPLCSKCNGIGNIGVAFKKFWKEYYEQH